ncbi:MAG TPA: hypothetical protein VF736_18415 [Pyrinomonadaceae bacterium]|jgi:hypothetical protein
MGILALLCLLGCVVCWIIVLIRMFKEAGVVQGIIGVICSLWAFIWGWMNSGRLGLRNIMLAWTVLLILYIVFASMSGGFSYNIGTNPGGVTP